MSQKVQPDENQWTVGNLKEAIKDLPDEAALYIGALVDDEEGEQGEVKLQLAGVDRIYCNPDDEENPDWPVAAPSVTFLCGTRE
jgi:hypothetical protein